MLLTPKYLFLTEVGTQGSRFVPPDLPIYDMTSRRSSPKPLRRGNAIKLGQKRSEKKERECVLTIIGGSLEKETAT
jgi:hypothetical protein